MYSRSMSYASGVREKPGTLHRLRGQANASLQTVVACKALLAHLLSGSGGLRKPFVYDMPERRKSLVFAVEVVLEESNFIECRWI